MARICTFYAFFPYMLELYKKVLLPETDGFILYLAIGKLKNCYGTERIATSTVFLIFYGLHALVIAMINLSFKKKIVTR